MKTSTILTTLLSLAAGGWLASAPLDASAANRPDPLAALSKLQGKWQGTVSLQAGGKTTKGSVSMDCRSASGGSAVLCETSFSFGGGVQSETDLLGYNPATGRYHWFAVCSSGEAHDHVATKLDGGSFEWLYEEQRKGGKFVERVGMAIAEDGKQIQLDNTMSLAGKRTAKMTGTIEKTGER